MTMCQSKSTEESYNEAGKRRTENPQSSFQATFINPTTILIIEDDSYSEQPHIYIKIYPDLLLITDTGTSSPREKQPPPRITLRIFLETVPIIHPTTPLLANPNPTPTTKCEPLNPSGKKRYLIMCTHAHYDHILGIPSFLDATPAPFIVASGNDPSFVTTDLSTHSLCKYLHIPTPIYTVSHWVRHLEYLAHPGSLEASLAGGKWTVSTTDQPELVLRIPYSLRVRCLHIPGHTPDSLAWYDIDEHHLYIGDMFYSRKRATSDHPSSSTPISLSTSPVLERGNEEAPPLPEQEAAIIFPAEGNWTAYMSSLDLLISFAAHENTKLKSRSQLATPFIELPLPQRVKVGCGHVTFAGDAESMAREVKELFVLILEGKVPVVRSFVKRGLLFDVWRENKQNSYIVEAPRRLCDEARKGGGVWGSG